MISESGRNLVNDARHLKIKQTAAHLVTLKYSMPDLIMFTLTSWVHSHLLMDVFTLILTYIGHFTRWPEDNQIPDMTADT